MAERRTVCEGQPHLPTGTRGKPRVGDRRVISGIIHVTKSGGRWVDAPEVLWSEKDALQPLSALSDQGRVERYLPGTHQTGGPPAQILIDSSAVRAHRCAAGGKGGERNQAIGRSRGGRTTNFHALTDGLWRPVAFLLTGGNVADCKAAEILLEQMPQTGLVNADKGYDCNAIRRQISARGAFPNIPPRVNRIWKNCKR